MFSMLLHNVIGVKNGYRGDHNVITLKTAQDRNRLSLDSFYFKNKTVKKLYESTLRLIQVLYRGLCSNVFSISIIKAIKIFVRDFYRGLFLTFCSSCLHVALPVMSINMLDESLPNYKH